MNVSMHMKTKTELRCYPFAERHTQRFVMPTGQEWLVVVASEKAAFVPDVRVEWLRLSGIRLFAWWLSGLLNKQDWKVAVLKRTYDPLHSDLFGEPGGDWDTEYAREQVSKAEAEQIATEFTRDQLGIAVELNAPRRLELSLFAWVMTAGVVMFTCTALLSGVFPKIPALAVIALSIFAAGVGVFVLWLIGQLRIAKIRRRESEGRG